MSESVEWARKLERQLQAEIDIAEIRALQGDRRAEALGMLADTDRLSSLRQRLLQVEHLIEAVEDNQPLESGWPAFLGDPRAPAGEDKARQSP